MLGRCLYLWVNLVVVLAFYQEGRRKHGGFLDDQKSLSDDDYQISNDLNTRLSESTSRFKNRYNNSNIFTFDMFLKKIFTPEINDIFHSNILNFRKLERSPIEHAYPNYSRNLVKETQSTKASNKKASVNSLSHQFYNEKANGRGIPSITLNKFSILESNEQKIHSQNRSRSTRDVSSSNMKSKSCHSQHLQTCGSTLIKRFEDESSSTSKCKIREEFLDCMVHQRERECAPSKANFSPDGANSIRSQVKNLLWSAHGCLLF